MTQDTGQILINPALTGPADLGLIPRPYEGQVAQLVEQRIENPRVGGSIPPLATNTKSPRKGAFLFVASLKITAASSGLEWRLRTHSGRPANKTIGAST